MGTRRGRRGGDALWSPAERELLLGLDTPAAIQRFLDSISYSTDGLTRSPAQVFRDRRSHCFDGAVLAAAALRRLGHPPLLVDLRAERDDDHVIAIFRRGRHLGALSKSNCAGLRFREPVFRSLRELVMSYFEFYFNVASEKTLRAYSVPIDLSVYDALRWTHDEAALASIGPRLDRARHFPIATGAMVRSFAPVDQRTYAAGMLGADEAGLFQPRSTG